MTTWPGWKEDQALAVTHAENIRRRLARVSAPALIARWVRVNRIPQRVSRGDAESFLMNALAAQLEIAFGKLLDDLWRDAWVVGIRSAMSLLPDESRWHVGQTTLKGSTVRCDLGHEHHGIHGAAGLLIRTRNEDGKRLFLMHKRGPDSDHPRTWALPGGSLHPGESSFRGAMRETREELGPALPRLRRHHTVRDDHGGWFYETHVMDAQKPFQPHVDGETPGEVGGWGWFTKGEVRDLDLHGGFKDSWDTVRHSTEDTVINAAMSQKVARNPNAPGARNRPWRRPMAGVRAAPLGDDPWHDVRDMFLAAGIPPLMAGPLASEYVTWENGAGATSLIGIVATVTGLVANQLMLLQTGEATRAEVIREIRAVLTDDTRIQRIAATEVTRAMNEAARRVYWLSDVDRVYWLTEEDRKVCAVCEANEAEGPVGLNDQFRSGDTVPPAHPHCRCALMPVPEPQDSDVYGSGGVIMKSAETPVVSTVHHPLGTHGLWHTPDRHVHHMQSLPAYIQNIAHALMREGHPEDEAIAFAINAVKRWAAGHLHWGRNDHVTPEVVAASARAVAQWEALRASHHGGSGHLTSGKSANPWLAALALDENRSERCA